MSNDVNHPKNKTFMEEACDHWEKQYIRMLDMAEKRLGPSNSEKLLKIMRDLFRKITIENNQ